MSSFKISAALESLGSAIYPFREWIRLKFNKIHYKSAGHIALVKLEEIKAKFLVLDTKDFIQRYYMSGSFLNMRN